MQKTFLIAQVIISACLIGLILLQQRGTALGSAFGGEGGGFYVKRRGLEKKIFWATVVLSASFIICSIVNLAL